MRAEPMLRQVMLIREATSMIVYEPSEICLEGGLHNTAEVSMSLHTK